jgi:hypothetical protein
MKIIDLSTIRDANGKVPPMVWLRKTFSERSLSWQTELDAQDRVIETFDRVLGNEFALLREVRLRGLDTPIPMVLVGPSGVFVLYASGAKGTYRARGDAWLVLDSSGNMHAAHPNLPNRARLYAEAVRNFLLQSGFTVSEADPILLFSRPEAIVENIKSPIRIVMCDGIESYANSLRLLNNVFSSMECGGMVNALANSGGPRKEEESAPADESIEAQKVIQPTDFGAPELGAAQSDGLHNFFTESEEEASYTPVLPDSGLDLVKPAEASEKGQAAPMEPGPGTKGNSLLARTKMNTRQITLLAVFALLDMAVVVGLILVLVLGLAR